MVFGSEIICSTKKNMAQNLSNLSKVAITIRGAKRKPVRNSVRTRTDCNASYHLPYHTGQEPAHNTTLHIFSWNFILVCDFYSHYLFGASVIPWFPEGTPRGHPLILSSFKAPTSTHILLLLEKAEESDIKLPTSTGLWKKQENSRNTSISALLTMPKPLTVWITINCGKF